MSVLWHEEKSMPEVISRGNTWIAPPLSEVDIMKPLHYCIIMHGHIMSFLFCNMYS